MARQIVDFQHEPAKNKTEEINPDSSCMYTDNMRDQPKAATLVFSPRRPGKTVENAGKYNKSTKKLTHSTSSHSLKVPSYIGDGKQRRKSLQILQPSADGQKLLVGGGRTPKKHPKEAFQSKSKQVKLHLPKSIKDSTSSSSSPETETASRCNIPDVETSSDEAYALMVQDRAPEQYWKLVAEERRKALEETLQENMKLYQRIEELEAENKELHEKENSVDYYATMYKIMQDDNLKPAASQDA